MVREWNDAGSDGRQGKHFDGGRRMGGGDMERVIGRKDKKMTAREGEPVREGRSGKSIFLWNK